MARHAAGRVLLVLLVALLVGVAAATSPDADRVDGERRVWRVVMEHLNAINVCSVRRLMAQHPYVLGRGQQRGRDAERPTEQRQRDLAEGGEGVALAVPRDVHARVVSDEARCHSRPSACCPTVLV